jgi:phage protein D
MAAGLIGASSALQQAGPSPKEAYVKVTWQEKDITASVVSVEVEDNDRLIDTGKIVLNDPQAIAANVCYEEEIVKIDLGWGTEHAVLFEGLVVRNTSSASNNSRQTTLMTYDLSHRMNRDQRNEAHDAGPLSGLVQKIVTDPDKRYRLEIGQIEVSPDPQVTEHQVNKTDLQFIQDLAARYSARAFVEFNDGKSKFYFISESKLFSADRLGTMHYCHGFSDIIDFNFHRIASDAAPVQSATTVSPTDGTPASVQPAPPDPTPPPAADANLQASLAKTSPGSAAVYNSALAASAGAAGKPSDQIPTSNATGLASDPNLPEMQGRRDPTRILGLSGNGTAVGTIKLRAKGKVQILGVATWAEGDWYVRKVVHVYEGKTYRTKFTVTR